MERFKEEIRYITRNGCEEADELFFQTAKGRETRLKKVGIDITIACIRGRPILEEDDAVWITKAMIGLRTKMNGAKEKMDGRRTSR